jgi:ABC-type multidrug transport system permease subunit
MSHMIPPPQKEGRWWVWTLLALLCITALNFILGVAHAQHH